jgi:hypothetical protein
MESMLWVPLDEPSTHDEGALVIALCTGDLDVNPKYGQQFVGPVRFTPENEARLNLWGQWMLDLYGGYVHWLLIHSGEKGKREIADAESDLAEWVEDRDEAIA